MTETRMIDDSHLWELLDEWKRRRRALGISEPRTDLAAIDLEVRRRLQQKSEASIPREVGQQRTAFTSTSPRLDFKFLYPGAWEEGPSTGELPRNLSRAGRPRRC